MLHCSQILWDCLFMMVCEDTNHGKNSPLLSLRGGTTRQSFPMERNRKSLRMLQSHSKDCHTRRCRRVRNDNIWVICGIVDTYHKIQNIHPHENPGERQAGLAPSIRARTDGATPASWLFGAGGTPKESSKNPLSIKLYMIRKFLLTNFSSNSHFIAYL